jgi:hypothetical protein
MSAKIHTFLERATLEDPWWVQSPLEKITQYDYPAVRLAKARRHIKTHGLRLGDVLYGIRRSEDAFTLAFALGRLVQDALIHNPVFQPSQPRDLPLNDCLRSFFNVEIQQSKELITDPLLLFLLGEARCGQIADVYASLLREFGFQAGREQLHNHVVTQVSIAGEEYLIDLDAFKNGVFFLEEDGRTLLTKKEVLDCPQVVDRFKHTGWMFRKNTRYARNVDGHAFTGYVDFFMPEEDGLISGKFGAPNPHLPPGVPLWDMPREKSTVKAGQDLPCTFTVPYAERATQFMVRICTKSRGYSYDHLVYKNLLNESSCVEEELQLLTPEFTFRRDLPRTYYITACALSPYLLENSCYVWWSDEHEITVAVP